MGADSDKWKATEPQALRADNGGDGRVNSVIEYNEPTKRMHVRTEMQEREG